MWAGAGDGSADETITAAIEIQKITEIGRTAYPFYRPDAAASRKDARFSGSERVTPTRYVAPDCLGFGTSQCTCRFSCFPAFLIEVSNY